MRMFAWTLMVVVACSIGCNKPAVETIPVVAPESSGTTVVDEHEGHDHSHEGEDAAEDADNKSEAAAEGTGATEGAEAKTEAAAEPSASNLQAEKIRFVADKRINVPGMMCPYSCWPKVQETLASQPGVEAVQLAAQPAGTAEGEIVERVVELKLNGDFDLDAAVAALAKVSFADAKLAE